MRTILFVFLISVELCYAQIIPHEASLTVSKDSVLSTEEFIVTYSFTGLAEAYIYIGVQYGYFETIGKDRWEGKIKEGETKKITFTLKLKESSKAEIEQKVPLAIGFSYTPFDEKILRGTFESVFITIIDFNEFKSKNEKVNCNNKGDLVGLVIDGNTNKPVMDAYVFIEGTSWGTETDSNGTYKLENVLPGTYKTISGKLGYHRAIIFDIQVQNGQNAIVNFRLSNNGIPEEPLPIKWRPEYNLKLYPLNTNIIKNKKTIKKDPKTEIIY